LFVEFQFAAKEMRSVLFVAIAACINQDTGYIGSAAPHVLVGYEATSDPEVYVLPATEDIFMKAMRTLLNG